MASSRLVKRLKARVRHRLKRLRSVARIRQWSLAWQVVVFFGLMSLAPVFWIASFSALNDQQRVTQHLQQTFETQLNQRLYQVSVLIEHKRQDLQLLARVPAWQSFSSSQESEPYEIPTSTLEFLQNYADISGFYDVFWVDLQGRVAFSLKKEADLFANLYDPVWAQTGLSQAFQMAKNLLDTSVSDFEFYAPSLRNAAFLATPIIQQNRLQGILVGQINDTDLLKALSTQNQMTVLGKIWVGKRTNDQILNVMYALTQPQNEAQLLGDYRAQTPIAKALRAEEGVGLAFNHLNQAVYASWRYLPDLRWGIVYEMPVSQAFAELTHQQTQLFSRVGLAVLFSALLALYLYGVSSEALKTLWQGIQSFSRDKTQFEPLPVSRQTEMRQITQAFNGLAEDVKNRFGALTEQSQTLAHAKQNLEDLSAQLETSLVGKIADLTLYRNEMHNILDHAPMVVMLKDMKGCYQLLNRQALELIKRPLDELLGLDDLDIFPPVTAHIIRTHDQLVLSKEEAMQFEEVLFERRFVMARFKLKNMQGLNQAICCIGLDVTQQRQMADHLALSSKAQKVVTQQLMQALALVNQFVPTLKLDTQLRITEVSDAFCDLTHSTQDALIGQAFLPLVQAQKMDDEILQLMADLSWQKLASVFLRAWQHNDVFEQEVIWQVAQHPVQYFLLTLTPIFNEKNELAGYQSFWRDHTQEKKIYRLSITDELTGLYNRRYYNQMVEQRVSAPRPESLAIVIFDVDYFKRYNDFYGHLAGDQVLRSLGQLLLKEFTNPHVEVFRVGGEEFLSLVSGLDESQVMAYAQALRQAVMALNMPHQESLVSSVVTISVGVAYVPQASACDSHELYALADKALYQSKMAGRNQVNQMNHQASE